MWDTCVSSILERFTTHIYYFSTKLELLKQPRLRQVLLTKSARTQTGVEGCHRRASAAF